MAAARNPAAALVLHNSHSDVDYVILNSEIVKENGKLLRVDWPTLKQELQDNMKELGESHKGLDWSRNNDEVADSWNMSDKLE